jgi:hypothetical protein
MMQKHHNTTVRIKAALEKKGQIIGENDIHIAAHATSHGLILVTNNLREFKRVPNLALENWVSFLRHESVRLSPKAFQKILLQNQSG